MGFSFSAVTALLGGYSDPGLGRIEEDIERLRRERRRRRAASQTGGSAGDKASDHAAEPSGQRADAPPVTGGSTLAVSGVSRALDALMAAEETRRRRRPSSSAEPAEDAAPLSAALRASLSGAPGDLPPAEEALPPAPAGERDWKEIRDLIEALARAERPAEGDDPPLKSGSDGIVVRPLRSWPPD
ncbi:hypothetical protein [Jiella sonneratiae]|uniref:Uncharacterized protein n=1 Tax=Jiella sonneratiae TaxID=2816856 RepID=A0ABS3J3M0_9HYPH|nr:hypothetical protein [Jiella sonneratiae]MBO0903176.1 hypothetical protein [Jiella sonneratiae]